APVERAREPGGGGRQKLVLDLSPARPQRQLQLFLIRPVLSNGPGPRRLLPTQSVSGHGLRDRLHLGRPPVMPPSTGGLSERSPRLSVFGPKRTLAENRAKCFCG